MRSLTAADEPRLREAITAGWGSTRMAARGRLIDVALLPGFVAEDGEDWLGYVTYELCDGQLEIAVIESLRRRAGVGSALLAACVSWAARAGASRVWLVTTNDNTAALRFYQRRGFTLVTIHRDAVTRARAQLKPEIPPTGLDGIPIRDELELELPRPEWPPLVERHTWPT